MTTLFDQAAREAIAHDLDHTLFVEAGAGTGKTSALVARLVALVQRGAPLTQIAAITFTEAAAAELRERVREALGAAATSGEPGADRCADALAHFDDTTISTLHAFAQRVLAEFPVEAGLPPGFEVLDDIQASIDFAERWARFLDRLYRGPRRRARARPCSARSGSAWPGCEALAQLIHDDWDRLVDQSLPAARAVPPVDPAPVLAALDDGARVRTRVSGRGRQPAPAPAGGRRLPRSPRGRGQRRSRGARGARRATQPRHHQGPEGQLDRQAGRRRGAGRGRGHRRRRHRRAHGSCGRSADAGGHRVRARVRRGAPPRRSARVPRSARARPRPAAATTAAVRGALARALPPSAARRVPGHRPAPDRARRAHRVRRSRRPATKPWWECSVPPGRLFVVGDPKQSIYRFRRADIELYHRVRDYFGDATHVEHELPVPARRDRVRERGVRRAPRHRRPARRSRPRTTRWSRAAMAPRLVPAVMARRHVRSPSSAASTREETDLASLRRLEAQELAALDPPRARRGLAGRRGATPTAANDTEPARYADIAVLLPTRATLPYLEQALDDAGIPARDREPVARVRHRRGARSSLAILDRDRRPGRRDRDSSPRCARPAFACRDDKLARVTAPPAVAGTTAPTSRRSSPPTIRSSWRCARCARCTTSAAGGTP